MNTTLSSMTTAYIGATNRHDAKAFIALFADTAVVEDAGREFRGLEAIQSWSEREIIAANVTLEVLAEREKEGVAIVTTKVDGDFDKTGLPDPLIIDHHLLIEGNRIVSLTCRLVDNT